MATYTIFAGVNGAGKTSIYVSHVAYMCNGKITWKRNVTPKWSDYILK